MRGRMKDFSAENVFDGIIIKGVGGLYTVRLAAPGNASVTCRARGAFRHDGTVPTVGDRVKVERESAGGDGNGAEYVISEIAERTNILVRPALSNLTHLFLVIPAAKPKPDLLTVDKLVSIADSKDIEPVIIVNKCDLDTEEAERIFSVYTAARFSCFTLSAQTGEGCGELLDYFKRESEEKTMVAAFAGASAAGKSTLMSRLFPELRLKTGEVSRKIQRGRHTTRHCELYSVNNFDNCLIADTPGFSMLDFTRFNFYDLGSLPYAFREFRPFIGKCRYTKCTHTKEEGCAILGEMEAGGIPKERHDSYLAIYEEIKKKPEWKRRKESLGGNL